MEFSIFNLQDKDTHQLHAVVDAAGVTLDQFYGWILRKRFAARQENRKITKIQEGRLYQGYSPAIKAELGHKLDRAIATHDACSTILDTMGFVPPERVTLTKATIEEMFQAAISEEQSAQIES
jgi:hypothetical protein